MRSWSFTRTGTSPLGGPTSDSHEQRDLESRLPRYHSSGATQLAQVGAGWVWDLEPEGEDGPLRTTGALSRPERVGSLVSPKLDAVSGGGRLSTNKLSRLCRTGSRSTDRIHYTTRPVAGSGIKRPSAPVPRSSYVRRGRPIPRWDALASSSPSGTALVDDGNTALHDASTSSESGQDTSASSGMSVSDCHSDLGSDLDEQVLAPLRRHLTAADDDTVLSLRPDLAGLLPDMKDRFYNTFLAWRARARYIIAPDHRIQPRHQRSIFVESYDASTSTTLITPVHGYYPLACPFSFFSPRPCTPLSSVPRLIDHLHTLHREPIYCPVCGDSFKTCHLRDDHVRMQACGYNEQFEADGLNNRCLEEIRDLDDPSLDEEGRWVRIWDVIYPEEEAPSPWVTEGRGLEVVMIEDWWRAEGHRCVEEYLEERGEWDGEVVDAMVAAIGSLWKDRVLDA
ncbi:hypothetical protein OQA88_922 [Cercophora sp. LCS_1]